MVFDFAPYVHIFAASIIGLGILIALIRSDGFMSMLGYSLTLLGIFALGFSYSNANNISAYIAICTFVIVLHQSLLVSFVVISRLQL